MASPVTYVYERTKAMLGDDAATPDLDLANDTIKGILVSSAYAPNYDTHANLSDVVAGQRVGAAVALTAKTWTKSGTGDSAKRVFSSAKVSFPAATARYMLVYKDTGTESTSQLICLVLLDSAPADVTSAVGIEVTPDATNGWFAFGKAAALA